MILGKYGKTRQYLEHVLVLGTQWGLYSYCIVLSSVLDLLRVRSWTVWDRYINTWEVGMEVLVVYNLISVIDGSGNFQEITLRWLSLELTDNKSTLVQVMACKPLPEPMSTKVYGAIRHQKVKRAVYRRSINPTSTWTFGETSVKLFPLYMLWFPEINAFWICRPQGRHTQMHIFQEITLLEIQCVQCHCIGKLMAPIIYVEYPSSHMNINNSWSRDSCRVLFILQIA